MKKECEFCAGSGQMAYFKGESRFLLSWDECAECGGLGFIIVEEKKTGTSTTKVSKTAEKKL